MQSSLWQLEAEAPAGRGVTARRHRLANGLGLITAVDKRAPIVAIQIWTAVIRERRLAALALQVHDAADPLRPEARPALSPAPSLLATPSIERAASSIASARSFSAAGEGSLPSSLSSSGGSPAWRSWLPRTRVSSSEGWRSRQRARARRVPGARASIACR